MEINADFLNNCKACGGKLDKPAKGKDHDKGKGKCNNAKGKVNGKGKGRKANSNAEGEVYADDELPGTIYPKFERIYRGGVLAGLQQRVPLARGERHCARAWGMRAVVARFLSAPTVPSARL